MIFLALVGSSPHTWRTLINSGLFKPIERIISTYVENTFIIEVNFIIRWDHLHIRGEHSFWWFTCNPNEGSSPHTWRTHLIASSFNRNVRIISTYVENTCSSVLDSVSIRDHLHIRGEHQNELLKKKLNKGSSPHTWRTLFQNSLQQSSNRIISTYVENTAQRPYLL